MSVCKILALFRFSLAEIIDILQTKDKNKLPFSDILLLSMLGKFSQVFPLGTFDVFFFWFVQRKVNSEMSLLFNVFQQHQMKRVQPV